MNLQRDKISPLIYSQQKFMVCIEFEFDAEPNDVDLRHPHVTLTDRGLKGIKKNGGLNPKTN